MATEAPPPYHEDLDRLKNTLTPEKREALVGKIAEYYEKPENKQSLVDEVKAVADSAAKVDELFKSVRTDLGQLQYDDVNYKNQWDSHYEEFQKLMKDSGVTALEAIDYLDEFTEIVMPAIEAVKGPDDVAGRKEAIGVLKDFLNKVHDGKDGGQKEIDLKELEAEATKQSDAFIKLQNKIRDFIGDFVKYATARAGTLTGEIATVTQKIKDLNDEYDKITGRVTGLAIGLGVTIFVGIAATGFAVACLGPLGWIAAGIFALIAVGEAAALGVALKEQSDKRHEIDQEHLKLEKLQAEQKVLARVRSTIESQNGQVLTIAKNIDQIGKVWLALAADAHRLNKELERFADASPEYFKTFQNHIALTKKLYVPVRDGLLAFVKHEAIPTPK